MEEIDYRDLETDCEEKGTKALEWAQFGFVLAPMSIWKAYAPTFNRQTGAAFLRMTSEALTYKNQLHALITGHKRRSQSRAYNWQAQERTYSFWVILRKGHKRCEAIDADNCTKLILDTFVEAGIVPDDKHCRESCQIYGDFEAAGWPKDIAFAVLVRWSKHIDPNHVLELEKADA